MTIARQRELLETIEARAKTTVADLTAAIAVSPSMPLLKLRSAWMTIVQDSAAAVREFSELHDVSEKTPVRPPSQANLAAVRGLAERTADMLDEGKR